MYHNNPVSQNNFKRRRKCAVNFKPVNPIELKNCKFSKFLCNFKNCFKRKKIVKIDNKDKRITIVQEEDKNDVNETENKNYEGNSKDISPLLREITTNFFKDDVCQLSKNNSRNLRLLKKLKSESSLCSSRTSEDNCRRKRLKISKLNATETTSDVDLRTIKQCISTGAFLTTSFFSLPHPPEYSAYPIHVNLHYAKECSTAAGEINDKSTQYLESDFLELGKHVKTSTGGLHDFNDNTTENADSDEYVHHNITQKIAHYFEITPIKRNKRTGKLRKHQGTNTSIRSVPEEEPTILYASDVRNFISTDESTIESKLDTEEESMKNKVRKKLARSSNQLSTKNCCTSTSDTCICGEIYPKFQEWYEFLQNNMRNHHAKLRHFQKLKNITSTKIETANENQENSSCISLVENFIANETKVGSNGETDCKKIIRKISELLVNDLNTELRSSFHRSRSIASRRNLVDILNQRYPTFIGFEFNNNETRKVKYTINKEANFQSPRNKVPKIIIRGKRKRNIKNIKDESINEHKSIISIATRSANVLEIQDIIESLLPKDPLKLKTCNSDNYVRRITTKQTIDQLDVRSEKSNSLLSEVEKMVDELLNEIPSTSNKISERASKLSNRTTLKSNNWNSKNEQKKSTATLQKKIKFYPVNENIFQSSTEASQTVIPLFHRSKLNDIKKKNRSEEGVRFELHEKENLRAEKENKDQNIEENCDTIIKPTVKSSSKKLEHVDINQLHNILENETLLRTHKLDEGFYAQVIQKTASIEHPLICNKISHSSTKSSVHSFIKSLLLCLKYNDSHSTLHDASIQCSDVDNTHLNEVAIKLKKLDPLLLAPSYSSQPSADTDSTWDETKRSNVWLPPNKMDKANMIRQRTNSVGVQVFTSACTKDKQLSSTSLTRWKSKKSLKRDTATQTKILSKVNTSTYSSSAECGGNLYKEKDALTYPSVDKKVSQIQTCEENIGIFSKAVEQKISNLKPSNQNSSNTCNINDFEDKINYESQLYSDIKRKSSTVIAACDSTVNNSVVLKRKIDGSLLFSDSIGFLTIRSGTDMNNGVIMKPFFDKLYPEIKCNVNYDLENEEVCKYAYYKSENIPLFSLQCEDHFLFDQYNIKSSLDMNQSTDKQNISNRNSSLVLPDEILVHGSYTTFSKDQYPSSFIKLVYNTENEHFKNVLENEVPSKKSSVLSKNIQLDEEYLPGTKVQTKDLRDNIKLNEEENQYNKSHDSDIFKFKSIETVIDETYIERIKHYSLKSGLRQHFSQLSNMKLKPVYVWKDKQLENIEEPPPVLENVDVQPIKLKTERIAIDNFYEKDTTPTKITSQELISTPAKEEPAKVDDKVYLALLKKLKDLDQEQKFEIQVSSSASDPDIEPVLANVVRSIEEVDKNFSDWLITIGIPLRKIRERHVQTSLDNLKRAEIGDREGETILVDLREDKEIGCYCKDIKIIIRPPTENDKNLKDYKITFNRNKITLTVPQERTATLDNLKKKLGRSFFNSNFPEMSNKTCDDVKVPLKMTPYDNIFELNLDECRKTKQNKNINANKRMLYNKVSEYRKRKDKSTQLPRNKVIWQNLGFKNDNSNIKNKLTKIQNFKNRKEFCKCKSCMLCDHTKRNINKKNSVQILKRNRKGNLNFPTNYNLQESLISTGNKINETSICIERVFSEKACMTHSKEQSNINEGLARSFCKIHLRTPVERKCKIKRNYKRKLRTGTTNRINKNSENLEHQNTSEGDQSKKEILEKGLSMKSKLERTPTLEACSCDRSIPVDEFIKKSKTKNDSACFSTVNSDIDFFSNQSLPNGSTKTHGTCYCNFESIEKNKIQPASLRNDKSFVYSLVKSPNSLQDTTKDNDAKKCFEPILRKESYSHDLSKDLFGFSVNSNDFACCIEMEGGPEMTEELKNKKSDESLMLAIQSLARLILRFNCEVAPCDPDNFDKVNDEELDSTSKKNSSATNSDDSFIFAIKSLARLIMKVNSKVAFSKVTNINRRMELFGNKESLTTSTSSIISAPGKTSTSMYNSVERDNGKSLFNIKNSHKEVSVDQNYANYSSSGYSTDSSFECIDSILSTENRRDSFEFTKTTTVLKKTLNYSSETRKNVSESKNKSRGFFYEILDSMSKSFMSKIKKTLFKNEVETSPSNSSIDSAKEEEIKKSLDDFFANVFDVWSSYSFKNIKSTTYKKPVPKARLPSDDSRIHIPSKSWKNVTYCSRNDQLKILRSILQIKHVTKEKNASYSKYSLTQHSYDATIFSNVSEDISSSSSDVFLKSEDVNDIWQIIILLSKLCPRVLCKYYIKRMLG